VLLLAGAFEPVDDARVREIGCDGVLIKPFEPQQVIARVRELLGSTRALPPPAAAVPSAAEPSAALDVYLDRLDAAFATLEAPRIASREETRRDEPADADPPVPTLDALLGMAAPSPVPPGPSMMTPVVEPPDVSAALTASAGPVVPATEPDATRNVLADAFSRLFASELQEPGAPLAAPHPPPPAPAPVVTDAMVDEVTRRVLARIAPDAVRQVVAEIVSEVAERLVREEIERIRSKQ
jgi:hypothetical protein